MISIGLGWEAWGRELDGNSHKAYAAFVVSGIHNGFRIGFNYSSHSCTSSGRNMISARLHPQPINAYIGPLSDVTGVQISHFEVIPKPHQVGKWRLITKLSSPEVTSVNDRSDPRLCSVVYPSVDETVVTAMHLGKGAILVKFDRECVYRTVPVHLHDRLLLVMRSFGFRSAPKFFTAVVNALLWIMRRHGVRSAMHYLDDFLLLGSPCGEECGTALTTSLQLCQSLDVQVAPTKRRSPAR